MNYGNLKFGQVNVVMSVTIITINQDIMEGMKLYTSTLQVQANSIKFMLA